MGQQQYFSHGLLYSVAPENFSELHLHEDERSDELDWNENESPVGLLGRIVFALLKAPAAK